MSLSSIHEGSGGQSDGIAGLSIGPRGQLKKFVMPLVVKIILTATTITRSAPARKQTALFCRIRACPSRGEIFDAERLSSVTIALIVGKSCRFGIPPWPLDHFLKFLDAFDHFKDLEKFEDSNGRLAVPLTGSPPLGRE